jgi:hypothetical protein
MLDGPRTGLRSEKRNIFTPVALSFRTTSSELGCFVAFLYDVVSAGEGDTARSCAGQESEDWEKGDK